MARIVKQFTKFIFPFDYDRSKINVSGAHIISKKGAEISVFEQFSQGCESLREGLESLLSVDGGAAKIAHCYKLSNNCRREFSLPARASDKLDFVSRQDDIDAQVSITDVKLYFFESSVGFAEIECEYHTDSLEDYVHLNYFISEAKSDKNYFVSHEKICNAKDETQELVDEKVTVDGLLGALRARVSLSEDAIRFRYNKSKPKIYSYLLLDEKPDNMDVLLNNIAKNYKGSYKFGEDSSRIRTLKPFDNSEWCASMNAAVNVSYITGDMITDEFFTKHFSVKMKNTYYFLYLNVIHQRDAINRIMGQMGHLDRLENDFYVMDEQLKLARKYEVEAINLKFRAFFKSPSTVEHINDYYNMIYDAYQIADYYDHFSADMKNLQGICSKYVERIKERDDKIKAIRSAKTEIFVSIFGAIVAAVALFNNSWSLVEKVMGKSISFLNPGILIMCATLLSSFITIAANVSKRLDEIKRLKKHLISEERDNLVEDDKLRIRKGKLLAKLNKRNKKK